MRTLRPMLGHIHAGSRLAVLVAILVAGAIALPRPRHAAAASYQPVFADGGGADAAAAIYCSPGLIRLGDPVIWAIPPGDAISSRRQWVAWSVSTWYSSDLKTWVPGGAAPYWYYGQVNDQYLGLYYNSSWYNSLTQSWGVQNNPVWTASLKGYYAATIQIIWYLEDGSVAILTGQPAAYTVGAGGEWSGRSPYCTMF